MKNKLKLMLAAVTAACAVTSTSAVAESRDYVSIVGSSTVYPFSTVVAERFGRSTGNPTPKVESTGSGGGLKLFCAGVGTQHPDITNASRRIKKSEFQKCQKNGVKDVVEVVVGYDGIVLANSKSAQQMKLSRKDIFMALAKQVPGKNGKLIDNPYKTWKEVNPALPNVKIEVLGPPPTSGTRDAFAELALGGGAKKIADLKKLRGLKRDQKGEIMGMMGKLGIDKSVYAKLEKKKGKAPKGKDIFKAIAYAVREDGAYVEAGENDNLIIQKLSKNPDAFGVFGFSFLDQNRDKVQGSVIEGTSPTFDSIADQSYPVARSLYFYIKKAHVGVVPGIEGYIAEFTAEKAWGDDGYLTEKGMIPLSRDLRKEVGDRARNLKPMTGKEFH